MAKDWELGIDCRRMNRDRLGRVVTKDGCEVIASFPPDRLLSHGMPGCEAF
jgi:hypothetical protein